MKGFFEGFGFWALILLAYLFLSDAWHSRWRIALFNGVPVERVVVQKEPSDCDFMTAPLGRKICHYDRVVSTQQIAMSKDGKTPLVSFDDGKSWHEFIPDPGEQVPQYPKVVRVWVEWKKVQE